MRRSLLIALLSLSSAPAFACDPSLSRSAGWSEAVACDAKPLAPAACDPSLSQDAGWSEAVACDAPKRSAECHPEYLSQESLDIMASVRPGGV